MNTFGTGRFTIGHIGDFRRDRQGNAAGATVFTTIHGANINQKNSILKYNQIAIKDGMQILNPSGKKDIDADKVKAFFGVSLCLRALVAKKDFSEQVHKIKPEYVMFLIKKEDYYVICC